jgi:type II secretory pathway component PulF
MSSEEKQRFDVEATTVWGEDVSQQDVEAGSVRELISRYRRKGDQVSSLRGSKPRRLFEPRGVRPEDFAIFNAELSVACKRGIPLPGALRALSHEMGGRRFRRALDEIAGDLEAGRDLPGALAARPGVFPPAYVAMVHAGLATGDLAGTLLVFSQEARLNARVRRNMLTALVYPLATLLVTTAVMSMIGSTLLPFVEEWFEDSHVRDLPLLTRFLLGSAPLMRWAPLLVIGPLVGGALAWRALGARAAGARFLGEVRLRLPLVGTFLRAVAMTRFCRTLAAALRAGVPVPESVSLAGLATGNAAIQHAGDSIAEAIAEGEKISQGLEVWNRYFPATLVWMLSLGESRGEVAPTLEEYARIQEENAERSARVLPVVIATLVTSASAALLFFSIIALMQPLFETLSNSMSLM